MESFRRKKEVNLTKKVAGDRENSERKRRKGETRKA